MTKILVNVLRYITLISVLCGQLLLPYYAYAGVGQQLYPVLLNAAINGSQKLAGTVVGRAVVGNPVLGMAVSSNSAGDANYDCMVAINPACLPSPDGWPRDSTGNPTPPDSANSTPAKFPTKDGDGRDDQYGPNSSWGQVYCRSSGFCWVWIKEGDDGTLPSPPSGFNWVIRGSFFADGYPGPITNANKYTGNVGSPDLQGGCPAGYLQVGGSCIIKDPSVVKKTGVPCSIVRVGNTYSFDDKNPACSSASNGQYQMADGNVYDASSGNVVIYPSWDDVKNKNPAATVSPTVDGGTQVKSYDRASNTTTTTTIKDGKVVSSTTEAGNTTSNQPGTGTGTGGTPITCQQVGTCGVSQEATQQKVEANTKAISLSAQQIASGLAMGDPIPGIGPGDYAGAVDKFKNMLPKPDDYRGPVSTMLKAMGFPESGGGQCSLTRTVVLLGRSITIQFVPNGICGPYQQVANWVTWGFVAIMAWQQVKSLAGDKSELSKG